jgi:Cd2+/Zn2+-exporting ATPase
MELKALGIERTVMITGDNRATAESIGSRVGVDEVRAELLPGDKLAVLKELERRYGTVAAVGDGVNDGPVLAAATVGIAMGAAGSDTALETADAALMGDDLEKLPYVVRLSRRARAVIRQNIAAAIAIKVALAIGVPLGYVSLITAVLVGDMGVSLAVTLNALRLGRVSG